MTRRHILAAAGIAVAALVLAGCATAADTASYNLSQAAENFEVQRTIIGVNGLTGETAFFVEGRCSIEADTADNQLEVTCKYGPEDYRKHFIGLSDNTFYVATQDAGIDVSEYHTRIIIKPQSLIPEFDIQMGERP